MADTWARDVKDFERDLGDAMSPPKIGRHLIGGASPAPYNTAKYGKLLIDALIMVAVTGRGPSGMSYPAYSQKYAARKQAAGQMRWLRGMKNTGKSGGMLGRERFHMEVDNAGVLWLVWESDGSQEMDVYGDLHNTGGPKLPARPWMHLESPEMETAIDTALNTTFEEMTAEFNAGRPVR